MFECDGPQDIAMAVENWGAFLGVLKGIFHGSVCDETAALTTGICLKNYTMH